MHASRQPKILNDICTTKLCNSHPMDIMVVLEVQTNEHKYY